MGGSKTLKVVLIILIFSFIAIEADTLDYPHNVVTNTGCDSCHYVYADEQSHLPPWTSHAPQDIDDTQYNTLCWSCHNDVNAPYMRTHSSLQTDNSYGDWTVECRVCHNPHNQKQFRKSGVASYQYSGISTDIQINQPEAGKSELLKTSAGWTVDAYKGMVVVPNVSGAKKKYGYKILGNTSDTLTIKGVVDLSYVTPGADTFAIIYGNLINSTIRLDNIIGAVPAKNGNKSVRFFNASGINSFADGDATRNGVCEACHTKTSHFRNGDQADGADQLHVNMGSPAATKCTSCHKHLNGFQGMGGGAHMTHVIDSLGPQLQCSVCHGANIPPVLGDSQSLANTTVCDNCHSSDGAVTAKTYWNNDPGTWVASGGESSFCGGCHDENPGNSQSDGLGDNAPNIAGDNSTYGFFVTGHGKSTGNHTELSWQSTSASGNPAANKSCSACHDLTIQHFNSGNKRIKVGYENDSNNSNCKQCHDPGTVATGDPQWFTTYIEFENSAHKNKKCTDCHDVHGASGANKGMTTSNQESLCYQCHKDVGSGGLENDALSNNRAGRL